MITVSSLNKAYGPKTVLDSVSFQVEAGQIFALIGLNGAGKSTLAKILMGFVSADSGSVTVAGQTPADPVALRAKIGYLAEETLLYGELSAVEHLRYLAELRFPGATRQQRNSHLDAALAVLDYFELGVARDNPIKTYSKGMRRKTALACALLGRPPVLILDEPTSGLDPDGTLRFVEILAELKQQQHTILINSHRLLEMQQRADRFGVLDHGNLVATGTLEELRKNVESDSATMEDIFLQVTNRTRRSAASLFQQQSTTQGGAE